MAEEIAFAGLKLVHSGIVVLMGFAELEADGFEIINKAGEFVVEGAATIGDGLNIFRLPVLFPKHGHCFEGDEEGGCGAKNDATIEGPFVE